MKAATIRVYLNEHGAVDGYSVFVESKHIEQHAVIPALLEYMESKDGRGIE